MAAKMYWLHALSPLHVGTGSAIGYVDLPIAREKTTGYPLVPGSGIKGVYSESWGASTPEARVAAPLLRAAFGIADGPGVTEASSGSIVFSDARLLCLPVRSLYGTFAWVTCPMVLQRLARDLGSAGLSAPNIPADPGKASLRLRNGQGGGVIDSQITPANGQQPAIRKAFLTDLDFRSIACGDTNAWADALSGWIFSVDWRNNFKQRFAVVADDVFGYFCQHGTEIVTRVRLEPDTRTVGKGLWTEELLPSEAILSGLVSSERVYHKVKTETGADHTPITLLDHFCSDGRPISVGGKQTVGRGRARIIFTAGGN